MPSREPLRVLETAEQIDGVKEQWDRLSSSTASPTQTASWVQSAAHAFTRWPLHVLVLSDAGAPAAVAPLVGRLGYAETASVRQLYEPVDLLWTDTSALESLAASIAARRLPLVLGRVPDDSPAIPALRAAYGRHAAVLVRPRSGLPVVDLDDGWREPESKFNADRRSDFRRARRRAEQIGPLELELTAPTPADVGPTLEEALGVELRSWKGEAGTALLQDPPRLAFFRELAARTAADGSLRIALLRAGGHAIAMQLGIERGGAVWLLKIAYDQEHRRASPGQLLMMDVLQRHAEDGLRAVEFLGTSAPWIQLWASRERPSSTVSFLPLRPGSLFPLAETTLRRGAAGLRSSSARIRARRSS